MKLRAKEFFAVTLLTDLVNLIRHALHASMRSLRNPAPQPHELATLQNTQETYSSLLEQSLQAVAIYQQGRIVFANPAAAELLKISVAELLALSPQEIVAIVHPGDRSRAFSQMSSDLASYGALNRSELRVVRQDGTTRWIDTSAHLIQYNGQPAIVAIALDITERKWAEAERHRLFEEARAARARLHDLSRRLLEVQETERGRIARELHDEIGQALTAVKIDLQGLQRADDVHDFAARLNESIHSIESALQQVRRLSIALRPSLLDDLGLVAALRSHVDCQSRRAKLKAQLLIDIGDTRLPPDVETICFRIVQEAMTNVIRHARASRVRVELRQLNAYILLQISDDGVGFDVPATRARATQGSSQGLLSMEDRVLLGSGKIEIISIPECGTTIRVQLPLRQVVTYHSDWEKVAI